MSDIAPLSDEEIALDEQKDIELINGEFQRGFDFIKRYPRTVTFFGSARLPADNKHCKEAYRLAGRVAKELRYAVVTGGGSGIMEAANHGAFDAGGESVGISIKLSHEQVLNPYVKDAITFTYFFVRKTMLTFSAEAFVFSPGGFGTLDELFDIMTLVQTGKIARIPIILFGAEYWKPLDQFIKTQLAETYKTISSEDIDLYHIMDNHDEIIKLIASTPVENWWKDFEVKGF